MVQHRIDERKSKDVGSQRMREEMKTSMSKGMDARHGYAYLEFVQCITTRLRRQDATNQKAAKVADI